MNNLRKLCSEAKGSITFEAGIKYIHVSINGERISRKFTREELQFLIDVFDLGLNIGNFDINYVFKIKNDLFDYVSKLKAKEKKLRSMLEPIYDQLYEQLRTRLGICSRCGHTIPDSLMDEEMLKRIRKDYEELIKSGVTFGQRW